MALKDFMKYAFGGDTQLTPEALKKRRELASAMMKRTGSPKNVGEGLDAASRSIMGALLLKQQEKMGAANANRMADPGSIAYIDDQSAATEAFAGLFGGSTGGGNPFAAPGGGGSSAPASGGYGGQTGSSGTDPLYSAPAALEPSINGPMTSQDALIMGGGPTASAGAMLDTFGANPVTPKAPAPEFGVSMDNAGAFPAAPAADPLGLPPIQNAAALPPLASPDPLGGSGNDTLPLGDDTQVGGQGGDPIASGIIEAATELGVDPVDLATAISYETAGTFDPTKKGPTTQWGQHRGLIQFGVPQAKKYGVDWSNPAGSQLGADGAIVKYLRDNGVKPGMGLLDIYSTINAGAPGLYNRSDANNGGAPGTVRDKVEKQMAGHREKALALIGRTPTVSTQGSADPGITPFQPKYTKFDFDLEGKKRPYSPNPEILAALDVAAAEAFGPGARITVFSGQEGDKPRHGSNRHGTGLAADIRVQTKDGLVKPGTPEAMRFMRAAARAGAKGIGAGKGYMGGVAFHMDMVPHKDYSSGQAPTWGAHAGAVRGELTDIMANAPTAPFAQPQPQGVIGGQGGDVIAGGGGNNAFAPQQAPQLTGQGAPDPLGDMPQLPPEWQYSGPSADQIRAFLTQHQRGLDPVSKSYAVQQLKKAEAWEDPRQRMMLRQEYAKMIGWQPKQDPTARFMTDDMERQLGLDPSGVYDLSGKVIREPNKPAELPKVAQEIDAITQRLGLEQGTPEYNQVARAIAGVMEPAAKEYKTEKLADGRLYYVDPTGQESPRLVNPDLEVATGDKNDMTEAERKIFMFNNVQKKTSPTIDLIEAKGFDPSNLKDRFADGVLGGNWVKSEEAQMYKAASGAWAEGALRLSTGAAATPEEFDRIVNMYFAQAGDSLETIKFKANMRKGYMGVLEATLAGDINAEMPDPLFYGTQKFYGKDAIKESPRPKARPDNLGQAPAAPATPAPEAESLQRVQDAVDSVRPPAEPTGGVEMPVPELPDGIFSPAQIGAMTDEQFDMYLKMQEDKRKAR
jgi:hypothetical protein